MFITQDKLAFQVYEAIEEGMYLELGRRALLEYLDKGDDGIFETSQSWKSFINGNFKQYEYWRDTPKESTIKKWCYSADEYLDKFVLKVGANKYIPIEKQDIELEYSYDLFYNRIDSNFPSSVEIYVTARIK